MVDSQNYRHRENNRQRWKIQIQRYRDKGGRTEIDTKEKSTRVREMETKRGDDIKKGVMDIREQIGMKKQMRAMRAIWRE